MKNFVFLLCLLCLSACGSNSSTSVGNGAYTVSGTVKAADGTALSGATVTFTGTSSGTATTGSDGKYSFTGVNNGVYQITTAKTGYAVTPASISVTVANADATGKDFTANPASYTVSGTITASGVALSGATVTLSGASTGTMTTDTNGSYSFSVLNGSYTVTPTLTGYNFTPATLSPIVNNANATGQDFTASIPAVKPAAAEVKTVYDQVNNGVNALCSTDVNKGVTATYLYASGTLSVKVTATSGTVFPLTVVYTLTNFVSGSYTISGTTTAIVTAADYWTSTGTLTASSGDISTIVVDMARNGDPNVMTGTLTVNGYPYDYATGAYK